MKKILLALAIISFGYINAGAQTKKSVYDKNYPVCLTGTKYKVCPSPKTAAKQGRSVEVNNHEASLRMMDTTVHMGYSSNTPLFSNRRNPRIRIAIDDPNAPYKGKENMTNDGQQKNKIRNINYLDNTADLPPNDGGLSDK